MKKNVGKTPALGLTRENMGGVAYFFKGGELTAMEGIGKTLNLCVYAGRNYIFWPFFVVVFFFLNKDHEFFLHPEGVLFIFSRPNPAIRSILKNHLP